MKKLTYLQRFPEKSREASKKWRDKNKDYNTQRHRKWVNENPDKVAKIELGRLKKKFGMTIQQFEEMVMAQDGTCAICKQPCRIRSRLSVDHDHETGKIRGLLCSSCNSAIGLFLENPVALRRAAEYLEKYKE